MQTRHRFARALFAFWMLLALAAPGLADDGDLYDCGKRSCSEWAPKEENTCRTCTTPQCRKQGDQELLVGTKKQNQCYPGHGAPPEDDSEE